MAPSNSPMSFFRHAASAGYGGPYLQRLSQLYSDTKQQYESAKPKVGVTSPQQTGIEFADAGNEDDLGVKALKREYQVQQDRLLAWGMGWAETGGSMGSAAAGAGEKGGSGEVEIDKKVEEAGLGEVVASVMGQIKDLLERNANLVHPARYEITRTASGEKGIVEGRRKEWTQHEVATSRALLEQLTTCIDVLYSLSEGRDQERHAGAEKGKEKKSGKARGLEDDVEEAFHARSKGRIEKDEMLARIGEHPLHIPFGQIEFFEGGPGTQVMDPPPYDANEGTVNARIRSTGYYRAQSTTVLVDFLTTDTPPYVVGTSDDVFELHELGEKLCRSKNDLSSCGHLRLLGFTVEPSGRRCGMVYELPEEISHERLQQHRTLASAITATYNLESTQPALEDRFRLAYNLLLSVLGYFAHGDSHCFLNSSNILLFEDLSRHRQQPQKPQIRSPYLLQSCQDFISRVQSDEPFALTIYRHPQHDPKRTDALVPAYDIYSLGLLMLEIGLWTPLTKLWKPKYDRRIFMERMQRVYSEKLVSKTGSKYMRLVRRCLHAPTELLAKDKPEDAAAILLEVAKDLRLCCALDEEGMPPTNDIEVFELLVIEQMCKNENVSGEGTSLYRLKIPGALDDGPEAGVVRSGAATVQRKPLSRAVSLEAEAVPVQRKPSGKRRKSSSWLKKWPELQIEQQDLDQWNTMLMPRLKRILEESLHESPESCSVSLMKVGSTPESAKTTICIQCRDTLKVHETLRKRFRPKKGWGVVILKGDVRRSGTRKPRQPRRSGGKRKMHKSKEQTYQEKPSCGASIGAFRDNEHLPPVSFGGTILVDGEPFGLTVHHMLDAPTDDEDYSDSSSDEEEEKPIRSAAREQRMNTGELSFMSSADDLRPIDDLSISDEEDELFLDSDSESEASTIRPDYSITDAKGNEFWFLDDSSDTTTPSLIADDFSDDEEDDDDAASVGDKPAVLPYSTEGEELAVTQPAIDDVDEDFFPCEEDKDEDHLTSHTFGFVHASSGIRRIIKDDLKHEVDWALIRIADERLDVKNLIAQSLSSSPQKGGGMRHQMRLPLADPDMKLTAIKPALKLSNQPVACRARSSGYSSGKISQALCLVKLHGRRSFSSSWCVESSPTSKSRKPSSASSGKNVAHGLLGIPGDSGAWVYNPQTGELCGHILAYGEKMKQAYIAPMEVLFEDIREKLGAAKVELPGGIGVVEETNRESEGEKAGRGVGLGREVEAGLRELRLSEQPGTRSSAGTERGVRKDVGMGGDVVGVAIAGTVS